MRTTRRGHFSHPPAAGVFVEALMAALKAMAPKRQLRGARLTHE